MPNERILQAAEIADFVRRSGSQLTEYLQRMRALGQIDDVVLTWDENTIWVNNLLNGEVDPEELAVGDPHLDRLTETGSELKTKLEAESLQGSQIFQAYINPSQRKQFQKNLAASHMTSIRVGQMRPVQIP